MGAGVNICCSRRCLTISHEAYIDLVNDGLFIHLLSNSSHLNWVLVDDVHVLIMGVGIEQMPGCGRVVLVYILLP